MKILQVLVESHVCINVTVLKKELEMQIKRRRKFTIKIRLKGGSLLSSFK